ncbi:MAG: DUF92 domain-containing protein [Candidatus Micrarchaeia archaeon]
MDEKGIAGAFIILVLIFLFGKSLWVLFLFPMLLFLFFSWIVTNIGKEEKKKLKIFEKKRSIENVFANGLIPVVVLFFYFLTNNKVLILSYLGAIAAITGDKFSSEIGVLDGSPRKIFGFKKIKKGESGGITLLGSFAGIVGSFIISLTSYLFGLESKILLILISGVIGNIFDSVFGVLEENGFGNKHTTNIVCSFFGALIPLLFEL